MEKPIDMGNYTILQTIGSGAFGKVKLAEHKITHEYYAIKIFKKSRLDAKPSIKEKINTEIALMKLMDHPHIIRLIELCESSRHLFIVTEYASHGDLFTYLCNRRSIVIEEAMDLFRQIIYGVDYFHNHSICHRDLKPENILLDENNNIKIGDLSFARWMKTETTDTSCGSPHYAAPEIIKGIKYNGKKADIWSCGVILYALLTGRLPFNEPNFKDLIHKIKNGEYRMPDFPDEVKDLIARMICVDPEGRITIEQIKHHKAFKIGLPRGYTPPLPIPNLILPQANFSNPPQELIDLLLTIGYTEEEIKAELDAPGLTTAKSFWALLCHSIVPSSLPWSVPHQSHLEKDDSEPVFGQNYKNSPGTGSHFYQYETKMVSPLNESPITSLPEVSWTNTINSTVHDNCQTIEFYSQKDSNSTVAEIQKALTQQNIDWLFPDDMTIYSYIGETYVIIELAIVENKNTHVRISVADGNSSKFNIFIEIICSALNIQRPTKLFV
ncbi:CAMK family protein kinase [Trichomonas vaginalis G3]|uniref:CAMK family protein kinase n=1 Tax=Trichomonas vaginalis (strain ATCC PRA-98 / G3) TaxID=412133 RepID=A2F5P8_TRIV3|nr:protein serine/threonine kinase protein [Trichomonas vaginalis G3]EAX99748.1 CAMK family protein kinase [Trichomonas vaginalis G3]KAI5489032.1 protein serine/threonine kinase protein [Trichomonas vaginalis G3]|eukprot:XP_001312678.1 CAMK family protein kinase [Trichomonas vaginalis G3]